MNGVDDYPKGTEVTTVAAAQQLAGSARLQPRALAVHWAGRRVAPGWCVAAFPQVDCAAAAAG